MKKLFIISNESISLQGGKFYCDNIDLKSTPEGLSKKFEVNLFGRKSNKKRSHEIKIKKIKIFNTIFSYMLSMIVALKNDVNIISQAVKSDLITSGNYVKTLESKLNSFFMAA